jgi:hypothetical protein
MYIFRYKIGKYFIQRLTENCECRKLTKGENLLFDEMLNQLGIGEIEEFRFNNNSNAIIYGCLNNNGQNIGIVNINLDHNDVWLKTIYQSLL